MILIRLFLTPIVKNFGGFLFLGLLLRITFATNRFWISDERLTIND